MSVTVGLGREVVRWAPRAAVTVKETLVPGSTLRKVQDVAVVRQVRPLGVLVTV